MVEPFRVVMKNGHSAFFILAAITYVISLFFWPTPAVPLVSAILLPARDRRRAAAAGGCHGHRHRRPGHGAVVRLCDRRGAGISAKAAGAAVSAAVVADRALTLSIITGAIALSLAYLSMRKHIVPASGLLLDRWQARAGPSQWTAAALSTRRVELARGTSHEEPLVTEQNIAASLSMVERRRIKWSKCFALVTPLAFLCVVAIMVMPKLGSDIADLKGGEAAALVGGVAAVLMMLATLAAEGPRRMLDVCPEHITDGFVFAFKAMGSVLPIAGFFFVGAGETAAQILGLPPGKAPSLLFELIQAYQHMIPDNHVLVAFGVLLVGMITGIDGSGFAGLPLTGTLAGALGPVVGFDPATLAAVGQMGAVWTGGGTLVAHPR